MRASVLMTLAACLALCGCARAARGFAGDRSEYELDGALAQDPRC